MTWRNTKEPLTSNLARTFTTWLPLPVSFRFLMGARLGQTCMPDKIQEWWKESSSPLHNPLRSVIFPTQVIRVTRIHDIGQRIFVPAYHFLGWASKTNLNFESAIGEIFFDRCSVTYLTIVFRIRKMRKIPTRGTFTEWVRVTMVTEESSWNVTHQKL